jgi:iron complex transport system substrate-binding protein
VRIVSLFPAATEWVCAFGAGASLVARSHGCDHPPFVRTLPSVTRPIGGVDPVGEARPVLDLEALYQARPDVIVTGATRFEPGIPVADLEAALATWEDPRPAVLSMAPSTLKQVLDAALQLAARIGQAPTAMQLLAQNEVQLQQRWHQLGLSKRSDPQAFPSAVCLVGLDPLVSAGYWVPEMVEKAGGRALCATPGHPPAALASETLLAADPDVVLLLACPPASAPVRRWLDAQHLRAVRTGRLWQFNESAALTRPGPRLYRAIELLSHALYPDRSAPDLVLEPGTIQRL